MEGLIIKKLAQRILRVQGQNEHKTAIFSSGWSGNLAGKKSS